MEPVSLWVILLCAWALTHYWLLPATRDRWKAVDLGKKIARVGTLAVIEKVRDLAAIGAVTLAGVVALVWLADALAVASFRAPKAVIETLASAYGAVKPWSEQYAAAVGIVGLAGAAVTLLMTARHARRRLTEAWLAKATEVRTRLTANPGAISSAWKIRNCGPSPNTLRSWRIGSHDTTVGPPRQRFRTIR